MDIRPIRTETDYETALAEIERLFDAAPNTPDGDRLEVLVTLVEAYEAQQLSHSCAGPGGSGQVLHREPRIISQ